jgi:uncharacterized membrane protein
MKLSPISLAVLPLLTMFSAQAAVYQIVELDTNNKVRSTSGAAATMQGAAVTNGSTFLDITLDLDTLDFESEIFKSFLTEEQLENAKNGNLSADVTNILVSYLANNPSVRNQPIGVSRIFSQPQNGVVTPLVVRDITGNRTNTEFAYAVNNSGQIAAIATAPAAKLNFTPVPEPVEGDDEEAEEPEIPVIPQPYIAWVPEPGYMLGYVLDGENRIVLPPAFTELGGGMSAAQDINNNGQVVGFTSAGVADAIKTSINGICTGNSQPLQYCQNLVMSSRSISLSNLISQIRLYQTVDSLPQGYDERGALWQLNTDGSASLVKTYGFLGDKATGQLAPNSEEYPTPTYYSRANAINDAGIAVGHSLYSDKDRKVSFFDNFGFEYQRIYTAPHATIYQGDDVKAIVDPAEWLASVAVDINNQDLVAGYAYKNINSAVRARLFTYDLAADELKFVDGFFNSSGTEPRALNNQGQIVGRAEVIIGGTLDRRLHGFVYDTRTDTFSDLNDLVGCDAPYTLVDATAINDNGEIMATALVRRPVLDAFGQQQTDDDGAVIMREQATAVKLLPIPNGQPANCSGEQTQYERKSGSVSAWWLILLAAVPFVCRRVAKR